MNVITKTVSLPDGRTISIETGKVAKQADGSCVLRMGNTVLLATVCAAKDAVPGTDFMPLQVDYREQYAAAGRFPGGFTKREGKAGDNEILTSRLVDRVLRPLFPSNYHAEVYVNVMLLSADGVDQPDALAGFAASAALACSDIPFECPISEVRVARVDGQYVINPTYEQMKSADMDIMVGASAENIMMVEGEMKEVSEQDMIGALKAAMDAIKPMCELQTELSKELGTDVKREYCHEVNDDELREDVRRKTYDKCYAIAEAGDHDKKKREEAFAQIIEDFTTEYDAAHADLTPEELEEKHGMISRYYDDVMRDSMRRCILDEGKRLDGRKTDEIRPIWSEVGILPRVHGSGVFTRGQTQVMTIATLAPLSEGQELDGIDDVTFKRYMHQYNMPPYSVGEVRRVGSPGRREIGHGALAERALVPMLPSEEEFPYAMRLVSEVISSNGSTSQASICASTLALMDAGVPIKKPVAGVAMGLIKDDSTGNIAVLTDIQGLEDFLGDMDFKVAGTREGITAIQMDIKIKGIDEQILTRALEQARRGRLFILDKMAETIKEPRADLSPYAPRIMQFSIHPDKIREVIGSGGKTINGIIAATGVKIDLEDDGRVLIATPDAEAAAAAKRMIDDICRDIEVGGVFLGKVVNILPIGAQVELKPGKKGLVHISRLANHRVEKVEDEVQIGDEILVRVIAIKPDGKIDLTRKELLPDAKK